MIVRRLVIVTAVVAVVWLTGLTVYVVHPFGPSSSTLLCTDALERRRLAEQAILAPLRINDEGVYVWSKSQIEAKAFRKQAEDDIAHYCPK